MDKSDINLLNAEDYIPQIMSLGNTADEANAALCLELISVCTEHDFLTGMLVGIFLCSKNKDTRNRALTLLDNKITPNLRRKMSSDNKLSVSSVHEYKHNFLIEHPEIDYCGCLFSSRALLVPSNSNFLNLSNVHPNRLTNSAYLKNLPINTLHLAIENENDDAQFAEIFKDFQIKWLDLSIRNAYLPIYMLQLKTVKYCQVRGQKDWKGSFFNNNVLEIPNLMPISDNLKHIFKLVFSHLNIKNSSNLGAFNHLKSIEFNRSSFENTTFLSQMPLLTRLIFNYAGLQTLPPETALLHHLTYLHTLDNDIKRIDLDFNNLPNLRELSIQEKYFNYITDTFYNCTELRSVSFHNHKKGFKLPQSLIEKGFSV